MSWSYQKKQAPRKVWIEPTVTGCMIDGESSRSCLGPFDGDFARFATFFGVSGVPADTVDNLVAGMLEARPSGAHLGSGAGPATPAQH